MLQLTWTETGLEDLEWWHQHNSKILKRIIRLCLETCKNPTQGIGKPEPLKFNLQGYWSRRITDEHRLIYAFDDEQVVVIQCRHHYGDR
ncbi:MAG: Txe/YoeB family addiction module toxin [Candidatus Parabeggiatoa sp. nov. 2]|nr:MAG: addiction module protein [Beggiatoa sp. 4572_84]RKZ56890.1 MAG: Txe/YoeB family addiction module toxin [Gammaproteobacteria bacterium]